WWSTLINLVIGILCSLLGCYAFNQIINPGIRIVDGIVAAVVYLWLFLAALGQTIRRLHDVGYSGYWYWAAFTGYGAMFLFYLELQPSVQRQVKWGKYLFSDQDYPKGGAKSNVPVPTIGQILKEHFFDCFKWDARSTRTSFWVGTAISQVIMTIGVFACYLLAFMLLAPFSVTEFDSGDAKVIGVIFIIFIIFFIAAAIWAFLAQLGHTVRRLHDAGFNGGWWWLGVIPYVGQLLLAFLLFHPTVQNEVKWDKYLFDPEDRIR
ncbi:DUF805 domain-containing protein, partial [Lactobacillus crispatus]|uniref:DUF805 domain-containing protein n=1 Tax=Lactobacillus crispatus TaxID=47770 RepID=UPI001F0976DA